MNHYELFCKKYSRCLGSHLSDIRLKKGDVIKFKAKYYIIADLAFRTEGKIRVDVWPSIIRLRKDLQDPMLLHWLQKNLLGLRIRLVGDKNTIEGEVIDFWPGIRIVSQERFDSGKKPEALYAEAFPDRMELLSILLDNPVFVELSDFNFLQIMGR
jgi:hypothetical protein